LSVRAISDLERGVNHSPRLSTVRMLSAGLDAGPSDAAALLAAAQMHPPAVRIGPMFDIRYATEAMVRAQPTVRWALALRYSSPRASLATSSGGSQHRA
jgi:hypothetical protein